MTTKHLIIIGGGSAAFAAALTATGLGARVTMINDGLPIGGTCVNVGCVPSKTLIRAAESLHRSTRQPFAGVKTQGELSDFFAVMAQKRELVGQLRQAKYLDVVADLPGFTRIEGRGRLVGPRTIAADGREIEGDRILIATGARPLAPELPGLDGVPYLTNETALDLDALPASMLVVGGGYIALELAQMFSRFGVDVTMVARGRILSRELPDLSDSLVGYLREEGVRIALETQFTGVRRDGTSTVVTGVSEGEPVELRAEALVIATGRAPNTANMGLAEAGVRLDARGFVEVDETLQSTAEGIYAAGDVAGGEMFVYTAADDGGLAARNAVGEQPRPRRRGATPWVIFTDPQVAGIGYDERQAQAAGLDVEASTLPLTHVPRAIAARDTRGFIKLVRERSTDRLVGARVLAPEGSELLMELAVTMRANLTVSDLRDMLHPYLTLSEGIKLAAITFGKSVDKLSCCAT